MPDYPENEVTGPAYREFLDKHPRRPWLRKAKDFSLIPPRLVVYDHGEFEKETYLNKRPEMFTVAYRYRDAAGTMRFVVKLNGTKPYWMATLELQQRKAPDETPPTEDEAAFRLRAPRVHSRR